MDPRLALVARLVAAASMAAASLALAQTAPLPTPPAVEDAQPPAPLPPPPEIGPAAAPPPPIVKPVAAPRPQDHTPPVFVPPPPAVLRGPVAVLQVLDKVTAETLRFEAPVGRRIRYKTLVIEVRACETRSYKDAQPRASAYLVVNTRLAPVQGSREPTVSEVFHGWTFAQTPSLHALEHPIYDLWLVACSASAPAA